MKKEVIDFFSQVNWKTVKYVALGTTATKIIGLGFYFTKRAIRNRDRIDAILAKANRKSSNK